MDEEGLQDTENKLIHIGKPIEMDEEKFMHQLIKLREAADQDSDAIRSMVILVLCIVCILERNKIKKLLQFNK